MSESGNRWTIQLARQPQKMLRRLPKTIGQRIDKAILSLGNNPKPHGSVKLVGYNDLYRIRVEDWRVIYAIKEDKLVILVVHMAPRGSVYRQLR